jgi:Restriction endonuclease
MNPAFELDQVRRYIAHLQANPTLLKDTVESHFFPVLQRIFFREGLEVQRDQAVGERKFPFLLKDLDLRRPDVVVDFAYQGSVEANPSVLPGFAHDWARDVQTGTQPRSLLVLRDRPLQAAHQRVLQGYGSAVRFLDFTALQEYATQAFETYESRHQQRVAVLVVDLLDKLIEAIAAEPGTLAELPWFDVERLFYRVLQGLGFHVHQTPSSHDGGRDVLACDIQVDSVHWYNIEIKHWTNRKVGATHAKKTLETALREGRRGALLMSTSGVSPAAMKVRTEIHEDYLRFGDGHKLVASCRHYTQARSGIWNSHGTLRSFLFSATS